MASKYGAAHGLPGYDSFRTGLTFTDVRAMLLDESEDRADWRYKRRGTVLGLWHQLKMEMYERAVDAGYREEHNSKGARRCRRSERKS